MPASREDWTAAESLQVFASAGGYMPSGASRLRARLDGAADFLDDVAANHGLLPAPKPGTEGYSDYVNLPEGLRRAMFTRKSGGGLDTIASSVYGDAQRTASGNLPGVGNDASVLLDDMRKAWVAREAADTQFAREAAAQARRERIYDGFVRNAVKRPAPLATRTGEAAHLLSEGDTFTYMGQRGRVISNNGEGVEVRIGEDEMVVSADEVVYPDNGSFKRKELPLAPDEGNPRNFGEDAFAEAGEEPAFATARGTKAVPEMSPEEVKAEVEGLRRAFPLLNEKIPVKGTHDLGASLRAHGAGGEVPAGARGAVGKNDAGEKVLLITARAIREKNAAGIFSHEMGHVYLDTLPEEARAELRGLYNREVSTRSGPLFKNGEVATEIDFLPEHFSAERLARDPELPFKEWFAERIRMENAAWVAGKMAEGSQPLLRRLAAALRVTMRAVWEALVGKSAEGKLFRGDFREFLRSGADEAVGGRAGAEFAEGRLTNTTASGRLSGNVPHQNHQPAYAQAAHPQTTPDPFTGVVSNITGSRVTAAQADAVAERTREAALGAVEPDSTPAASLAQKQFPKVVEGGAYLQIPGRTLPKSGGGGEVNVYTDAEQGVVYKVFFNDDKSRPPLKFVLGRDGLKLAPVDDAAMPYEKAWAITSLGGTPTEVVGETTTGEVIVKQPLGQVKGTWNPKDVDGAAKIALIPPEVLKRPKWMGDFYYASIDGHDFIIGDNHVDNYIGDTLGRGRINDLHAMRFTEQDLKGLPKFRQWIEAKRPEAKAPGAAEFATGGGDALKPRGSGWKNVGDNEAGMTVYEDAEGRRYVDSGKKRASKGLYGSMQSEPLFHEVTGSADGTLVVAPNGDPLTRAEAERQLRRVEESVRESEGKPWHDATEAAEELENARRRLEAFSKKSPETHFATSGEGRAAQPPRNEEELRDAVGKAVGSQARGHAIVDGIIRGNSKPLVEAYKADASAGPEIVKALDAARRLGMIDVNAEFGVMETLHKDAPGLWTLIAGHEELAKAGVKPLRVADAVGDGKNVARTIGVKLKGFLDTTGSMTDKRIFWIWRNQMQFPAARMKEELRRKGLAVYEAFGMGGRLRFKPREFDKITQDAITAMRDNEAIFKGEGRADYERLVRERMASFTAPQRRAISDLFETVTRLSGELEESGFATPLFKEILNGRMDSYLNRSYRIFGRGNGKYWRKLLTPGTEEHATRYLPAVRDYGKQNVDTWLENIVARRLDVGSGNADYVASRMAQGATSDAVKMRTLDDPVIRNLFGEIADPVTNAMNTVMLQTNLLGELRLKQGMVDLLVKEGHARTFSFKAEIDKKLARYNEEFEEGVNRSLAIARGQRAKLLPGEAEQIRRRIMDTGIGLDGKPVTLPYEQQVILRANQIQSMHKGLLRARAMSAAKTEIYNEMRESVLKDMRRGLQNTGESLAVDMEGSYKTAPKMVRTRIIDPLDQVIVKGDAMPFLLQYKKLEPELTNLWQDLTRITNANLTAFNPPMLLRNLVTSWQTIISSGNLARAREDVGLAAAVTWGHRLFGNALDKNFAGEAGRLAAEQPVRVRLLKSGKSVEMTAGEYQKRFGTVANAAERHEVWRIYEAAPGIRGTLREIYEEHLLKHGVMGHGALTQSAGNTAEIFNGLWERLRLAWDTAALADGGMRDIGRVLTKTSVLRPEDAVDMLVKNDEGMRGVMRGMRKFGDMLQVSDDFPKAINYLSEHRKAAEAFSKEALEGEGGLLARMRAAEGRVEAAKKAGKAADKADVSFLSQMPRDEQTGELAMTAEEFVHFRALKRFRDQNFDYSRATPFTRWARKVPIVGQFTSFSGEVIRTLGNSWENAARDVWLGRMLGNNALVEQGLMQGASLTALCASASMITWMSAKAAGLSYEDERNARRMLPKWIRGSDIWWYRTEDGKLAFRDIGGLSLFGQATQPLTGLLRRLANGQAADDPTDTVFNAVKQAAWNHAAPFVNVAPASQALIEAFNGKKETGTNLWASDDGAGAKLAKSFGYVAGVAFMPRFLTTAARMFQWADGWKDKNGNPVTSPWHGMFLRTTLDSAVQLRYIARENNLTIRAIEAEFKALADFRGTGQSYDKLLGTYQDVNDRRQAYFMDIVRTARFAKKMGATDKEITEVLRGQGFSYENIKRIMKGDYVPYRVSADTLQRARASGYPVNVADFNRIYRQYQ